MRRIAVIGATGTAGRPSTDKLRNRDLTPVEISRSKDVDLHSGEGLRAVLADVEIVIDASNARFPRDDSTSIGEALTTATRNVVDACTTQQVAHLVLLSISGIQNPVFDDFPYYVAKRDQEQIVSSSGVPSTIVRSTQWYEFATNPTAVTFQEDQVVVQDWLIQPIAADTVADVLVEAALGGPSASPRIIAGPEVMRLPDLTTKCSPHEASNARFALSRSHVHARHREEHCQRGTPGSIVEDVMTPPARWRSRPGPHRARSAPARRWWWPTPIPARRAARTAAAGPRRGAGRSWVGYR
jgi:uncharacterized protein YbjT (DUF2867 family)